MYYDVKDVAAFVGCGVETVRRWISQGELNAIKVRNHYKIKKEELYKMLLDDNSTENKEAIADYFEVIIKDQED